LWKHSNVLGLVENNSREMSHRSTCTISI